MKDSKAVDEAIRKTYARLATAVAKRAARAIEFDEIQRVEPLMGKVETWLRKAGARATNWYYSAP